MSLVAGLSATKTGFDLAKGLVELIKRPQYDPSEIQARLLELQGLMLEAQRALSEADDEKRKLLAVIEEKDKQLRIVDDLEFVADGGYYVRKSEKEKTPVPYCPLCWGANNKLVPLIANSSGDYYCAIHNAHFSTESSSGIAGFSSRTSFYPDS